MPRTLSLHKSVPGTWDSLGPWAQGIPVLCLLDPKSPFLATWRFQIFLSEVMLLQFTFLATHPLFQFSFLQDGNTRHHNLWLLIHTDTRGDSLVLKNFPVLPTSPIQPWRGAGVNIAHPITLPKDIQPMPSSWLVNHRNQPLLLLP